MNKHSHSTKNQEITLDACIGGISPKKRRNIKARKENFAGWIMGGIPLLGRILFTFIPIGMALVMAFFKMPRMNTFKGATFVKFDNFSYVFNDPNFWKSVGNTFIYMLALPITIILSLILASALNSKIKCRGLFRAILMIPYVCSAVAIVFVFKRMYNADYGVINAMFGTNIGWITDDAPTFRLSLIIMMIWAGCGYRMLLLMAALTSVSDSYYEAADIDGANAIQKFFHITLPAVSPTLFYLLVTGCVGSLQVFTESQVMAMDGGSAVDYAGLTMVFYLYREGFQWNNMGVASAAALILSGMILILTLINFKLSDKWVRYD